MAKRRARHYANLRARTTMRSTRVDGAGRQRAEGAAAAGQAEAALRESEARDRAASAEAARLEAEAAVRRSEEQYRLVNRATNDVIWDWDLETNRVYWNGAVVQHFGCTPEELGDGPEGWYDRIHPEDKDRVIGGVHAALDGGCECWTDEYRFRKSDGSYAPFLDRGYIGRSASGAPTRMIGSMLDLTERHRAEAALRESELFHRQTLESIPGMVWATRPDGYCEFFSEQWVEFTGVPAERQFGDRWLEVLHPDDRERVFAAWRAAVGGLAPYDLEYRIRWRDGGYQWFKVRGRPIRDASGRIVRWFGIAINIHDLKTAEQALRDADRRKDEFLAMLAHELRNPLAPVRTAVAMLRRIGAADPVQRRARDVIDRQVTHMVRLIDDLLDISRIARGRIQLHKARCDLVSIVRQTAEDYRANLEVDGVALSVIAPDEPLWVEGDDTRLAQMLGNLLQNAGKFTHAGGRVRVRVEAGPPGPGRVEGALGQAVITVEDNGVGMDPALLARLFDPFSQADQGLARSKGGLGLGLALVKGLAELHGGTVAAQSDGPGCGSTFTLRLPLAAPIARDQQAASDGEGASRRGLRVLVIEDNHDAAESLEMLLTLSGYDVETAFDGPTGLTAARTRPPDVVLCDLGLPGGMDGYDVARAIRAEPSLASTRLVALSGYGQDEDRRRSREAGFDKHLVKPAEDTALMEALSAGRRELRAAATPLHR
ncbi:hybrid sensor histidine kinase/response regulator [Sorangium sp. So ce1000]|uniref:hybrid sensor histidine kinase/response regulator n=1 Tax=Sorangium sp. So ce1000 TaxID=3133325 RepID=UPI003F639330